MAYSRPREAERLGGGDVHYAQGHAPSAIT
jgi:hypothetical protein